MPPRLVIFDMDDVLCSYDLGRRLRALSRISGKTPRDIRSAIWDSGFESESDAGGYPESAQYLAEFGKRLGHPISADEWIEARRESMVPTPEMLDFAKQLASRAQLVIFSNNGPLMKEHLKAIFPEAAEIFREVYCSCELACKKPDPKSYLALLGKVSAAPEEAWFIDDKRSNVEGARLAGLRAHHFRSPALLFEEARNLGLV